MLTRASSPSGLKSLFFCSACKVTFAYPSIAPIARSTPVSSLCSNCSKIFFLRCRHSPCCGVDLVRKDRYIQSNNRCDAQVTYTTSGRRLSWNSFSMRWIIAFTSRTTPKKNISGWALLSLGGIALNRKVLCRWFRWFKFIKLMYLETNFQSIVNEFFNEEMKQDFGYFGCVWCAFRWLR